VSLRESQLQVERLRLNVAVGPESGPPLVLFHGVTRRWQTFLPILPALAARWQVFAPDFPGHGRSQPAADGSYLVTAYVRVAVEFIKRAVPHPAIVYGHSLGAMVTAAVAAEIPEHVRAIVLEDPPFDTMGSRITETPLYSYFAGARQLAGSQEPVAQLALRAADLEFVDPQTGVAKRVRDLRDAAAVRFTASCLRRVDPRVLEPIIESRWLEGYEWTGLLGRICCPVLLLQADPAAGGMLTDEDADTTAELIPDCTRVRLPRAGHVLHWERTQDVSNLVTAFLEALD
jgi:pimeloyl-ACP methyl ester carboxylesterase